VVEQPITTDPATVEPVTPQTRIGRCPDCNFDWDGPADALPPAIAETGRRFRQAITGGLGPQPGEREIRNRPADGGWSAIEYLAHVADVVTFFDERIARILTEDRPVFESKLRFADLAEARSYRNLDVDLILDALDERVRRAGTRLAGDIAAQLGGLAVPMAASLLGNRVAYTEALGAGLGVGEMARGGAAAAEIEALRAELMAAVSG